MRVITPIYLCPCLVEVDNESWILALKAEQYKKYHFLFKFMLWNFKLANLIESYKLRKPQSLTFSHRNRARLQISSSLTTDRAPKFLHFHIHYMHSSSMPELIAFFIFVVLAPCQRGSHSDSRIQIDCHLIVLFSCMTKLSPYPLYMNAGPPCRVWCQ